MPARAPAVPEQVVRQTRARLGAEGDRWLARLPAILDRSIERWSLTLEGRAWPAGYSQVLPMVRSGGERVVLKLSHPDGEMLQEVEALRFYGGRGAVRLLEVDVEDGALLLERCEPGGSLQASEEDEANRLAADVLRRLWRPLPAAHGFDLLTDEAARWARRLGTANEAVGRPFARSLMDETRALARDLGGAMDGTVLLHQDLHHGNVLSSSRGWLAIDPKCLAGERAYDTAPLLRDRPEAVLGSANPSGRLLRRFDLLADELGLDRARMRGWGVVQTVAWGIWSFEVGDVENGRRHVVLARLISALRRP